MLSCLPWRHPLLTISNYLSNSYTPNFHLIKPGVVPRWTGRPLGQATNWTRSMTASSSDQPSCTCRPSSTGSIRHRRTDPTLPECRRRRWSDRRRRRGRCGRTRRRRRRPTSSGRRRRKARTRARKWRAGAVTITSNTRDQFDKTFRAALDLWTTISY